MTGGIKSSRLAGSIFAAGVVFVLLLGQGGFGAALGRDRQAEDEIRARRTELEKIRKELAEQRRQAGKLEKEESSAAKRLARIEVELSTTRKLLRKLERQDKSLTRRMKQLESRLEKSRRSLKVRQESVAQGVRRMYELWRFRYMEVLFSDSSLPGILGRYRRLALVSHRQAQGVAVTLEEREQLSRDWEKLQDHYLEVSRLRAEKQAEKKRLAELMAKRKKALQKIKKKKESYLDAIAELEKTKGEIERVIDLMEKRRLSSRGEGLSGLSFDSLKGILDWPALGKLIGKFGRTRNRRFGTETMNSGIDIGAAEGSPIKCVAPGVVEYVNWLPGYGNCIIINHGNGYYTLYGHAAEVLVETGSRVAAGSTIATVGDSGSIKGTCLHFEIRKGASAVDPLEWLKPRGR